MRFLRHLQDIILGGYEKAKDDASNQIAARFSRGNTATQNGYIMDEAALARAQKKSNRAFAMIRRMIARAS